MLSRFIKAGVMMPGFRLASFLGWIPIIAIGFLGFLFFPGKLIAKSTYWTLPSHPPAIKYGNILINRVSERIGQSAVTFSHWSHRQGYSCRVCHFELGFAMKTNETLITEKQNRNGEYCGACHDGKAAFGHSKGNCRKCHNGDLGYGSEKFKKLASFPESPFGNGVDWVKAVAKGVINPKLSIMEEDYQPIPFDKDLLLEADWAMIPPAIFSHETHNRWLDCANCHPDVFNVKKKTTKHFAMTYILEEKFCGACHLNVAFPLDDCQRCHPGMK